MRINPLGSSSIKPEIWERVFRTAQVPLYVEDFTQVRLDIGNILASGVEDFGNWLDAHPEFVGTVLQNLTIMDANDRAVEIAGARDKGHLIQAFECMIVPETLTSFKEILLTIAEGRPVYQGESQYRTLDGKVLFTYNRAIIPQQVPGEADIMVLARIDITDLKETQNQLGKSESRYRSLVETAEDIILCHELTGKIQYVNQAGVDLTGWSLSELQDKMMQDLVPERMQKEIERRLEQRVKGFGGMMLFEVPILNKDGDEIPMEIRTTRIPSPDLSASQIIALMRDVSERKAMELKMLSTQKMESLGALAGGIAHDFNNLLATILGNTEMMVEDDEATGRWSENLESILEAGRLAADLCQQMLDYSGRGEYQLDHSEMGLVVQDIRRLMEASVGHRARLNLQLAAGLPSIKVHSASLGQVIMALVSNAMDALDEKGQQAQACLEIGEVVVRTFQAQFAAEQLEHCTPALKPGHYVVCEVADSGAGMTHEVRSRLFDPFFTTRPTGRGLGLSAALGIVQGHDGGMIVDSQPGVGTTVSVLLPPASQPMAKSRRRRKKAPDTLHQDLAGKLVLLVDEDVPVRKACEGYLRRLGCHVLSVGNGPDSVRIFSRRFEEVDVVILDLGMVEMDAVATMRRLREIRPDVPVIFSTGFGEAELDKRVAGVGEYGYMAKPFQLAHVRQALAVAIGKDID